MTTYQIFNEDCLLWLKRQPENQYHAIVTDPPYGLVEYSNKELEKMKNGVGGVWRIPPTIGGSKRNPLPRFTVLTESDLLDLSNFFTTWGSEALRVLVPGSHLIIASNPLMLPYLSMALIEAGFENRGAIVRLVRTLKGGFRPKLSEDEFQEVSSIPRSCWEPWGLFRKPFKGRLSDNLRKWNTGGLRRNPDGTPFTDVILSERTPVRERKIAQHPSLKPQSFLRQVTYAALPLGIGIILDPFCGSGSTLAAAEAIGYQSIGIEINPEYYKVASTAIPKLQALKIDPWSKKINQNSIQQTLADANLW